MVALNPPQVTGDRYAQLMAVVDADTLRVTVHESPEVSVLAVVRLSGLNAPEARTPDGDRAARWVREWMDTHHATGPTGLIVRRTVPHRDKYGRWLVVVWSAMDGACLNQDLLAAGLATPWDGRGPAPAPEGLFPDALPCAACGTTWPPRLVLRGRYDALLAFDRPECLWQYLLRHTDLDEVP